MSQTLFTTQTPALDNQDDNTDYTLGTLFSSDVDGTITGIRWWYPSHGVGNSVTGLLYRWDDETSGTLLASKAFSTATAGTWSTVTFDTPVPILGGQFYVAARYSLDHFYVATGGLLNSPIINGHLTAPADGVGHKNGRFLSGVGSAAFPTSSFNGGCYFVDPIFEPGAVLDVNATSAAAVAASQASTPAASQTNTSSPAVAGRYTSTSNVSEG